MRRSLLLDGGSDESDKESAREREIDRKLGARTNRLAGSQARCALHLNGSA
eukprot:COSAG03_NODE_14525_length_461_cov_0.994475_1_plen_50_part_01